MAVRITSKLNNWYQDSLKRFETGIAEMAVDIHREAVIMAPKKERNLVNSGRITRVSQTHYRVSFGSQRVRYAKIRHEENKKNPGTVRYLETPTNRIARNIKRYFR